MHVAVKVLQHTGANSHPVLNEVHLMLSFSHPNVVKGYHYICWGRGTDPSKEVVKVRGKVHEASRSGWSYPTTLEVYESRSQV
jgi:dTDP-4-dehydrorhamnose 3,5-epimerase-like enzyme